MGNNPSSEAIPETLHKRGTFKPQKLSKPRVEKNPPPHSNALYNCALSIGSSTGYASSYLTASLPISPVDSHVPGGDVIPDNLTDRFFRRGSQLLGDDAAAQSALRGARELRCPPYYAAAQAGYRLNSIGSNNCHQSRPPVSSSRSLVRTQSWHEQRAERVGQPQGDSSNGLRRLSVANPDARQEVPIITVSSHQDMQRLAENASRRMSMSQVTGDNILRTHSDVSLYVPVRRRSIIQTPGIATRREREPISSAPNASRSRPQSRGNSSSNPSGEQFGSSHSKTPGIEDTRPKPMMTLRPRDILPHERASTPCDLDYQQVGGHKFGTLRITNGSPVSSPTREESPLARAAQQGAKPTSSYAQSSSSVAQDRSQTRTAALFHEKFSFDSPRNNDQRTGRDTFHGQQSISRKTSNQNFLVNDAKSEISPLNSRSGSTSSTGSQKTSSKYDSGYGSSDSNGSIRSFQGGNQEQDASQSPPIGASLRRLSFSKLRRQSELLSPSLHAMADLAQAALTSKVPSLKLGRGKSGPGHEYERAEKSPSESPAVEKRLSQRLREFRAERTSEPSQTSSLFSSQRRAESQRRSLVGRASHGDLYSARSDSLSHGSAMPNGVSVPAREASLQSSKAQRSRGMTDVGVPPPIPAQFRATEPVTFQPRNSSLRNPQRGNTFPASMQSPASQRSYRHGGASHGQWSHEIERPGQFPGIVAPYDGAPSRVCIYS